MPQDNAISTHTKQIKNFTYDDLSQYFHLPVQDAANQIGCCPTTLKKLCRQENIQRWPYRALMALAAFEKNVQLAQPLLKQNQKATYTKLIASAKKRIQEGNFDNYNKLIPKSATNTVKGLADRVVEKQSTQLTEDELEVIEVLENLSNSSGTVAQNTTAAFPSAQTTNSNTHQVSLPPIREKLADFFISSVSTTDTSNTLASSIGFFSKPQAISDIRVYLLDALPTQATMAAYRNKYIYNNGALFKMNSDGTKHEFISLDKDNIENTLIKNNIQFIDETLGNYVAVTAAEIDKVGNPFEATFSFGNT